METKVLSPREKDVFKELITGLGIKQIACKLFISFHTADTHIRNMKRKKNADSIAELVYKVLKDNREYLAVLVVAFQIFITFQNPNADFRKTKTASRIVRVKSSRKIIS